MRLYFLLCCLLGFTVLTGSASPQKREDHPGKAVYDQYCLTCHQADAKGVGSMNPPLTQTEWVLGDKTRLIKVVLNGLNEEIEIRGEVYQNAMPPHNFLTDQQIADVLTYVRSNFGNQASAVTPAEVAQVRNSK